MTYFPVTSKRLIHSLSRQSEPMSQHKEIMSQLKIVCRDNLMAFLKIEYLTFSTYTHITICNIFIVKTYITLKNLNSSMNNTSHFFTHYNSHDNHQGSQGISTTKLFPISCSKNIYIPSNFNYAFSLKTVR